MSYVFANSQDFLIHNYSTLIKSLNLTLMQYYYVIHSPRANYCLNNIHYSVPPIQDPIQDNILDLVVKSIHSSFRTVHQSFFSFHDLGQ